MSKEIIVKRPNKVVYVDGDKIVKLFNPNHPKANILNEALNQARIEESTNLNVPKLLEVCQIDGGWALVLTHSKGKTLQELMDLHPEKIDEYLEMFVNIQLEVLSNSVPLLGQIKDKFKRKISSATIFDEQTKYELLQRLESMKNHFKLCHGDFNPSNIIIKEDGSHDIIDWAHATNGNASADSARTYLLFSLAGKTEIADKYLKLFSLKSGIEVKHIQSWLPIVAATQMLKGVKEEQELLSKWVNVVEYQ